MLKIILSILVLVITLNANAKIIYCTHPEICRMAQIILDENNTKNIELLNIIMPSGDPHEFEPTIQDIKKLIQAPELIVGPIELNPWMKKISYIRSKDKNLKTINLPLPESAISQYPTKTTEALGHFWLYPDIFCQFKKLLTKELGQKEQKICDSKTIEALIARDLKVIPYSIILTHDALLPLLNKLAINKNQILAIKGSSHHEEVSASSVKKVYDALKEKKVIWILEENITAAENIKNKIRPSDIVIKIDSAKSNSTIEDFNILLSLHKKLQGIIN